MIAELTGNRTLEPLRTGKRINTQTMGARHVIPITIGRLWDDFFARRPDLKKWTRSNLDQTKLRCVEFFKLKPVAAINQGDAKDFRRWLVEQKYSTATVSGFINKTR